MLRTRVLTTDPVGFIGWLQHPVGRARETEMTKRTRKPQLPVCNGSRPPRCAPLTDAQLKARYDSEINKRIAANHYSDPVCFERPSGIA